MGEGVEGLSDRFAVSRSCQGDVIWLWPTMKVISRSNGISGEPWLLQRPRYIRARGVVYVWTPTDRADPEGNLNGLCIFPPSTSEHIIHAPRRDQNRGIKIKKDKTRGRFSDVNRCQPRRRTPPAVTPVAKLSSSTCIYSWVQTEILNTVNVRALSVHVCGAGLPPACVRGAVT